MALAVENRSVARPAAGSPPALRSYERFSESALWALQRAYFEDSGVDAWRRGEVPHYITSTAGMAKLYAATILRYWEGALAAGDLDLEKPLYVLELGAGCGRLTYLLLKALCAKLAHARPFRLCYVASDIVEANLDFIASHPYLAREVEGKRLDTALWDAEAGGPLRLRAQNLSIVGTGNPLVVVANYVFDGLRHDLFAFHYGRTYEGRVAVLEDALDYEWQPVEHADWLPPAWQRRVARYAERLDSASLLFPSGALRCLDHVGALTRGRYLLLSADKGVFEERQLRLDSRIDIAFHGSFSLPVNYHALSGCLREQGAKVWSGRHRPDGLVYHVALRAAEPSRYDACFAEIAQDIEALNPDDHFTLKKAMETVAGQLSAEQVLSMLRLSCYDSRVLGLAIDAVSAHAASFDGEARRLWRDALERCWANFFPLGEDDGFALRFGRLAMQLRHWGLAREALRVGLAFDGEDAAHLYQLALCQIATGASREALGLLERALGLEPGDARCGSLCADLRSRLAAREASPWQRAAQCEDGGLTLEPLGIEHAASLLEQYRDPQIGILTRLPELRTLEEAVEWIVRQEAAPGCGTFAVLHRSCGFVGVVALSRSGTAGYFYFWTGIDHQGAGYGRRAAQMLFRLAAANGIREIFTSAYASNTRSRAALSALGFRRLEVSAAPPDDELLFFHRALDGGPPEGGDALDGLLRLCEAIGSAFRFEPAPDRQVSAACSSSGH